MILLRKRELGFFTSIMSKYLVDSVFCPLLCGILVGVWAVIVLFPAHAHLILCVFTRYAEWNILFILYLILFNV